MLVALLVSGRALDLTYHDQVLQSNSTSSSCHAIPISAKNDLVPMNDNHIMSSGISSVCKKMGHSQPLFLYFRLFYCTVGR